MTKGLHAKLVSPLLAAIAIICLSAFSGAVALADDPGQNDPVGAPANYITLRNDNLALGTYVNSTRSRGGSIKFDTYGGDLNKPDTFFSTPGLASKKVASAGSDNSVTVAGRILFQHRDELVNVGRSGTVANAVRVRFQRGNGYTLPNLHKPLADAPDQISVAAGDLDKIPDRNGANHDELVVAYPNDTGQVNVVVLNYTVPPRLKPCANKRKGSCPNFVTNVVAPFKVSLASPPTPFSVNGDQKGFKLSEVLAVAIGDFDGDGQNEIALATLDPNPANHSSVNLAVFRYVHPTLTAIPALRLVTQKTVFVCCDNAWLVPTISLAAGNFDGTRRVQLVLATRPLIQDVDSWELINNFDTYGFDGNLNPTFQGEVEIDGQTLTGQTPLDMLTPGRILCLPGLINFDPGNGFNLYRRGVVVVYNEVQPADDDGGALLRVKTYTATRDPDVPRFLDWTNLGDDIILPNQGIGASFGATLGAFGVNGNIKNPVWSLAVAQLQSRGVPEEPNPNQETVSVFQNIDGQGFGTDAVAQSVFSSQCASVCESTTQNQLRPAIQAYDYQGRTVLLGAPVKLTVPKLITTDFVLQEPPKHAFWDPALGLVVVSRNSATNVSLMNKQNISYSGKSTDTSASSVGGSISETASLSIQANVLGLFQTKFNLEETAKATYNYDENQASYNSTYTSRTLTETGETDTDDFISGRFQKLTIWRYRVLGTTAQDSAGNPLNLYYDVVFPGPALAFSGGGLSFDWYQPIHEPGNILSYPTPSNGTFSPADMGTYEICPAKATECKRNGKQTTGPLIGNIVQSLGGSGQSIAYDYVDTKGQGIQVSYQKKLGTSLDIKAGFSTEVGFFGGGDASFSESLNLNSSNSWGNTTTSDSTNSSETGIKINLAPIDSTKGYDIYPTLYTTLDGTIKAAFAADPLGNANGRAFWAHHYGALPDPALNLPSRFAQNGSNWIVNDQSSRKQMRGFFVLSKDPDPVTGEYDHLVEAPVDGDKIRLSAQIYNYSTAQSFKDCLVQFYAIKYDSDSDQESGARRKIGQTTISLAPRETASAQIIWDTTGFGPAGGNGSQDYRIYVDLNYDKKINETYPPEDPNKTYAPGLAKGVDPGQNDEGFGSATVMASRFGGSRPTGQRAQDAASSNNHGSPAVTFSSIPLAWTTGRSASSRLATNDLFVGAGVQVRLRAQVCSTVDSLDPVDVVVFDGEPAGGRVIAWKKIYVSGNGQCKSTWFDWAATRGEHNLVATIDPTAASPIIRSNAGLMTESSKRRASERRASLKVHVP